jgi:hypothetical protein
MGPAGDPMAVVDPRGRSTASRLYVAVRNHASGFRGRTPTSVAVIAEKIAALLLE